MSSTLSDQRTVLFELANLKPKGAGLLATSAMIKQQQISLADLPVGMTARVSAISQSNHESDLSIIQRLVEIGFVPGEKVKVIAHGHPGREPIAVRIGGTTFALRRFEADYIYVVADE